MDVKTKEIVDFGAKGLQEDDVLKMPVLYLMDKGGKYRFWQIIVGVTKDIVEADRKDTDGEWLEEVKFIPVDDDIIARGDLPDGAQGIYWTRSGQEGGSATKITKPTYVAKGTNVGKKNYTTPFTAALRKVMSKYNDKLKDGMTPNKADLKPRDYIYTIAELCKRAGDSPWRVFPMAFHSVEDEKNWKHIKFPAIIQPKYDGTRLLSVNLQSPECEKSGIDTYSRGRENFTGQEHIIRELEELLADYPNLYLDGELWKKGYGLQDISGSSRRLKTDSKSKRDKPIKLEYHVFDSFYVDKPQEPFEKREKRLIDIFAAAKENGTKLKYVHLVPTTKVATKEDAIALYESFIEEGDSQLEGAIIRNVDSPYQLGVDKEERTYKSLKMKPRDDKEYKIVGFTEGTGKNKNLIIWICVGPSGKQFTVTPNWTEEKREKVFKLFKGDPSIFDAEFKDKLAVIQYSILSKDDMPQQPKFLRFYEPSLDEKLNELI